MRIAALFVTALLAVGCSPTVNGVCDDLDDECPGYIPLDDCENDGHDLEDLASAQGCDQGFEDYLDCIDTQLCDWHDQCLEIRDELDKCVGDSGS